MSQEAPRTPPRPPGRPRSERARKAVLRSAFEILEERGIAGLTMEAVAARAGVGKPTIYRYWSNAHELAMAAIMERSEPEVVEAERASPWEELASQVEAVIGRFATPAGRQAGLLVASADAESELAKAFRNQVILRSREAGRAILERAVAEGIAGPTPDLESALDMIYGAVFFRLLVGHAPLDRDFAKRVVDTVADGLRIRGRR